VLCLPYDRSFDDVVAIYDNNWYIKRLNNIEIDKNKCAILGRQVTIFGRGLVPLYKGSQSAVSIPLPPLF